jgi:hypothetical protein
MANDNFCKILIYGRVHIYCEGVDNTKNYEKMDSHCAIFGSP